MVVVHFDRRSQRTQAEQIWSDDLVEADGEDVEVFFWKNPLWGTFTLLLLFNLGVFWSLAIFIQFGSHLQRKNPNQKKVPFFFFAPAAALSATSFCKTQFQYVLPWKPFYVNFSGGDGGIFFFSFTNFFNTSFLPCSAIILISFFFALHSFIFDPHFFYISCPTYLPSECSIYFLFIYATLGGCRNTGPLGGGWENFWIRALSSSLPSFIIIIIFIMIITIQFANTRLVREIFWGGCLKCGGGEKGRWGH